jgi:signal transduction histidine kinase
MIGAPFLVLGLLLVLSALVGAQLGGRFRGRVGAFLLSPLHPATWHATLAIWLGFWVELLAFALVASAFSAGSSMLIVGIGVVVIGLGVEGSRLFARAERSRASIPGATPLRPHAYRPYGHGARELLLAVFVDVNRWRDVLYVLVAFPLTVLEFAVTVALWAVSVALLSLPIWYAVSSSAAGAGWPTPSLAIAVAGGIAGLAMAPVAASVAQGLMALHRAVVAGLLCESEERVLARRVETLEGSRRAVLDVEASELRRIERDLHDGAQQRLVMLAIDLSLAAEKIESDPASARELVVDARDQARQALAELRDLVRGIAPAILLDRGLVPALSAIAGRCPVPTAVESTLPAGERLPDAVERAAYFVVAEALTNVAKHASAGRCEIRCRRDGERLVVEIRDDGAGGARIVPGGGLAGLVGRVEALDGSLAIESPPGGPTTVRAEMPALPMAAAPMAAAATPVPAMAAEPEPASEPPPAAMASAATPAAPAPASATPAPAGSTGTGQEPR